MRLPNPLTTRSVSFSGQRPVLQVGALLLLTAILWPLLTATPGRIIAVGDDFPFWLNANHTFVRDLFLWDAANGGLPSAWPMYLVQNLCSALLRSAAIPTGWIQAIEASVVMAVTASGMLVLARLLFPGRAVFAVSAAIFSIFNVARLWDTPYAVKWTQALLPLLLLALLLYFRTVRSRGIMAATPWAVTFAAVSTAAASTVGVNLPQLVVLAAAVGCVALFELARRARELASFRAAAAAGALLVGLTVLLNAWWLAPMWNYYHLAGGVLETTTDASQWAWTHARASFLNQFQLTPAWAWQPEYPATNYFVAAQQYTNSFWRALAFVPAVLALAAPLLARTRKDGRLVAALAATLLVLLFLGKGLHEPLSDVNLALYRHVPGFWLLREPWPKLSPVIILLISLLAGFTVQGLYDILRAETRTVRYAVPAGAVLLLVLPVAAFPLLVPGLRYGQGQLLPDARVTLPRYWTELSRDHPTTPARVLIMPKNTYYQVPYVWGGYFHDALPSRLLPMASLQAAGTSTEGYLQFNEEYPHLVDVLYGALEGRSLGPAAAPNTLGILNARYVLVRNDYGDRRRLPLGSPVPDPRLPAIHDLLAAAPGVVFDHRDGNLEWYRLDDAYFLPRVYAPATIASVSDMLDRLDSPEPLGPTAFVRPEDTERASSSGAAGGAVGAPAVRFQQISPTKYRVSIRGAQAGFLLVLSEGFSPWWKAYKVPPQRQPDAAPAASYFDGAVQEDRARSVFFDRRTPETWLRSPLPEASHLRVNGYANGWRVTDTGDYDLVIEYWPQRLYYWGIAISIVTLIGGVLIIVLPRLRSGKARAP